MDLLVVRYRDVDVRLNWSVAVVAALITWSLADSLFPDIVEGRSAAAYWGAAAATSALFLVSLAAHEFGHALAAAREGIRVRTITLWLFGGLSTLEAKPSNPRAALRIAIAGPIVSGGIGVGAVLASLATTGLPRASILWFGGTNLILMVFNLLPAFPLDGGRVYQAWLWRRTEDEDQATRRAVETGMGIGAVLVGFGVLEILLGAFVGGVWMMAIGWFVREAARSEWRGTVTAHPLSDFTVGEVMTPNPVTVAATSTIAEFIAEVLHGGRHAAYPVAETSGDVIGLITVSDIRRAAASDPKGAKVADLTLPLSELTVTSPERAVGDLLSAMSNQQQMRALVFDGQELVGIVSPSDLTRLVAVLELAALSQP